MSALTTLERGFVRATASPVGGQLLTCAVDGRELLYLSPLTDPLSGGAIRGGVPVCFPWFGNGPSGALQPSHGFARTSRWTRLSESAGEVVWQLDPAAVADSPGRAEWPFAFLATCRQSLTEAGVRVALTVRNTGEEAFTCEALLHTYLRVSDAAPTRLSGLSGSTYLDKLNDFRPTVQDGDVGFTEPLDRIYSSEAALVLHDSGRALRIDKQGSATTVVWNPGDHAPADVPAGGWRDFVCVEAGNVGDRAITLDAGAEHTLATEISLIEVLATEAGR
ncbi:D-hexose-6-phosphate mutarotase [Naumannella halotolerans]|uniref:D-hexose-6-phosphate mutarotase n=1 Tax=Naumannella halotolerans TaxID=993414 RepID=UPI00370CFFAE